MRFRDKRTGKEFDNIVDAANWFCEHNDDYYSCYDCPLCNACGNDWIEKHIKEAAELMGMEIIDDEEKECSTMNNKIYDIDFTKYNCVHPATEEDAKILLEKAYEAGYSWIGADKNTTLWDIYYENTIYNFHSNKDITYGHIEIADEYGFTVTEYPFTAPQPRICDILGVECGEQFTIGDCAAKFEILYNGHYKTIPANVPNSSYAFLDAIQNPSLIHKVPTVELSNKDREFFQMIYDRMGDGKINTLHSLYLRILFDRDGYSCVNMPYDTFDTKFEKDKTYKLSEVIE